MTSQYAATYCTGVCNGELRTKAKRSTAETILWQVMIYYVDLKIVYHCRTSLHCGAPR